MKNTLIRWGNVALEIFTLGAIVIGTLGLGGVLEWSFAAIFGLLAAAFCLWAGMRLLAEDHLLQPAEGPCAPPAGPFNYASAPPLIIRSRLLYLLTLAIFGFIVCQTIPLPAGLARVLSATRVERGLAACRALNEAPPTAFPIALDAPAARGTLLSFVLAPMALILGAYVATNRQRARRLVACLLVFGLCEALYGLGENLSGHDHIFWIPLQNHFASGTFFNRNHFAALLALLTPLAIGWFYHRVAQHQVQQASTTLLPPASWNILYSRIGLWLLVPAVLLLGVIQSASRGGLAGLLCGTALFYALCAQGRAFRLLSWMTLLMGLVLLAYAVSGNLEVVIDRFGELTESGEGRTKIWHDSLGMLRDHPWFGVGVGNFATNYRFYATSDTFTYPFQAHNEWLEGAATLGFCGMALLIAQVVNLFTLAWRRLRRARRDQTWLIGAWCGLVGLGVHSFVEFNFHIPSLTVTAFFLLGILIGFNHQEPAKRRQRLTPLGN